MNNRATQHATEETATATTLTRVRYRVVAFTIALAGVTYLDRVCISILAPNIMRDLNLTAIQMSYVFSAFTLAYAIFEIPTARWADHAGSRRVLTRIVLWWSAFTMATAAALTYGALLIVRFLFGVGEAGAWPNAARVFARWIPARERGRVQGLFFAGAHLSGGLTPMLVAYLATTLPWRVIFVLFGCVGLLWALAWRWWFRDEPRDHRSVSDAERDLIESTRGLPPGHAAHWTDLVRIKGMLPLCIQYFANTYGFYFFITWLPTYLMKHRGMKGWELATFAGLPLVFSVAADILGGVTTDALSRRLGIRIGRCGVGAVGYLFAAIAMLTGTVVSDGAAAGFLIAIGGAASMFTLASAWATAIDLGGRDSGVLSAIMNTAGQVGGILSPIVLAYIVDRLGSWSMPIDVLSGLYLIAAVCWLRIHPERRAANPRVLGENE